MAFVYIPIMLPDEVVNFASIAKEFPKCNIRTIKAIEFENLLECLGQKMYEAIMDDLVDYSAVILYSNTTAYVVGNIVCFDGLFYTNISDVTGTAPPNKTFWVLSPKFGTACYETLFCQFLGEWIAWLVVQERIPFWFRQFQPEGLVKKMGKTFEGVDVQDFRVVQKAVYRNVERAFENIDNYIKLNFDNTCYVDYKPLGVSGCCNTCGCNLALCSCDDDCNDDYESAGYTYQVG